MNEGVTCSVLAQPNWRSHSCLIMSKGNNTMPNEHEENMQVAMGGFKCEYTQHAVLDSSHNGSVNEDFFIEDLSEFSNEDIAAPIMKSNYDSPLQQHSEGNSASTIKSECTTTTTHTSSSASNLLEDSALDFKAALLNEFQDSSLSLPCQDETGFEWLTSLGEDDLICDGSNLGMDSFLLCNAGPFSDYDGMMKHSEYEDAIKVRDINMGQNSTSTTSTLKYEQDGQENRMWHTDMNGLKRCNGTNFTSHATGSRSARSKRARSSGWSSSSILCHRWPESHSPTDSLNSTSQILMPTGPQYNNTPSFMYKQQKAYTTNYHANMEINFTSRLISNPNSEKHLSYSNKASKFGSGKQWPKEEEDTTREESVSNYGGGLQPRRCTHCLSQKTPQWRAGPEGPKTLCNACGVRYKSGRLFDEYRPAKSPTFLSYKHSNSHKKVMEMRRRKILQYNQQHQQHVTAHHVRASLAPKHAGVDNQHLISKFKVKLNSPAHTEFPTTPFSDVTLISTRNALDSPSSFLY